MSSTLKMVKQAINIIKPNMTVLVVPARLAGEQGDEDENRMIMTKIQYRFQQLADLVNQRSNIAQ